MDIALSNDIDKLSLQNVESTPSCPDKTPFSDVIRRNHTIRDVTDELKKATQALRVGQLVKHDTFTLLESVQALEIMDPKMDSGCLAPGDSLDDDFEVCSSLGFEQVLGIIDQMLSYEMAWYQGYPLSQTLFTSLHLDHLLDQTSRPSGTLPLFLPSTSAERDATPALHLVLRAYCIGIVKSCDITVEMTASQLYYEEEDFYTQTYGRDLLTDVADADCIELLGQAIDHVKTRLADRSQLASALLARLHARKDFIDAFLPAPGRPSPRREFERCLGSLAVIQATHDQGIKVPTAFSTKVHRRLASTAPPRPAVELAFAEVCDRLHHLYRDLLRVLDAIAYDGGSFGLRTFLWTFASRKPQPCTFARAFLQSLTVGQGQVASPEAASMLLEEDLQLAVPDSHNPLDPLLWSVEHPADERFQTARAVDNFWERAGPEFSQVCRCLCQNRCRIRRCLANCLESLDALLGQLEQDLEAETSKPGHETRPLLLAARRSFVHCIQLLIYQVMAWVVQLGFEQGIMHPHELRTSYSLMWNLLDEVETRMTAAAEGHDADNEDSDFENSDDDDSSQEDGPSSFNMNRVIEAHQKAAFVGASATLASAFQEMYILLYTLGLLSQQLPSSYSTARAQRELRLRPLLNLQHSRPLQDLVYGLDDEEPEEYDVHAGPVSERLNAVRERLDEAKQEIRDMRNDFDARAMGCLRSETAFLEDLQRMEKSCVRALLLLHALQLGCDRYGAAGVSKHLSVTIPPAEQQDHAWWLVPALKARQ